MSILSELKVRFAAAMESLTNDVEPLLAMIRPSQDARFGDFQANCAMPLAGQLGRSPRDVAAEIVAALNVADMCDAPEIAGPGFINLRLRDSWIEDRFNAIIGDDRLGVAPTDTPKHFVVDFSSPNVAKPMHVGHLRSSVIGDALCRTLRFAGHKVTSDNHIGDWGTQFGMIIYGYRNFADADAYNQDGVAELARLYKLVNQFCEYQLAKQKLPALEERLAKQQALLDACLSQPEKKKQQKKLRKGVAAAQEEVKSAQSRIACVEQDAELHQQALAHPDILIQTRRETSKLHAGDTQNQSLWDEFLPQCLEALNQVYSRLNIEFDLTLGESFYNPFLPGVIEKLDDAGLTTVSDGATCVFLEGNTAPFIVRKTDGAYTYATTDLATIQYRVEELHADEILYVVDKRQSEHFDLLFRTAALWGFDSVPCHHVSFGTVMGKDGKPYKTRSGVAVGLEGLIDEAISRARSIVDANDDAREEPVLTDEQRQQIAEIVGIGGIKYADLHHNRDSDYEFDWDKMLATTGDTATYIQYAYARVGGIFRRANVPRTAFASGTWTFRICAPEERSLALKLLQFDEAILCVLNDYRPSQLTSWVFETADSFATFFNRCPVLKAETEDLRNSRLVLCDVVARGIRQGLDLLGIETADVM